jgi:hypothetical protein
MRLAFDEFCVVSVFVLWWCWAALRCRTRLARLPSGTRPNTHTITQLCYKSSIAVSNKIFLRESHYHRLAPLSPTLTASPNSVKSALPARYVLVHACVLPTVHHVYLNGVRDICATAHSVAWSGVNRCLELLPQRFPGGFHGDFLGEGEGLAAALSVAGQSAGRGLLATATSTTTTGPYRPCSNGCYLSLWRHRLIAQF